MINLELEDLPNELLLKILSYLNINSIISCGLLSKRIRFISHDASLWQKINLYQKTVPTKFLKFVMKNGCKYLSLSCAKLKENSTLQRKSDIRFLKDLRLNLKNESFIVKYQLTKEFKKLNLFKSLAWVIGLSLKFLKI